MIKTFVTMIPLQGKRGRDGLWKGWYLPKGFLLEKNRETSFPIVPIIANEAEKEEKIKVIVIRTDNTDTPDNYGAFIEELDAMDIEKDKIKEITFMENQGNQGYLKLLLCLLAEIPEDSLVYADITYGTKPMSATVLYAMSFIEKMKDSEVEGIYYGELPRQRGESISEAASLHDFTGFKYLSDIVEEMKYLEVSNPLEALKDMLNIQMED